MEIIGAEKYLDDFVDEIAEMFNKGQVYLSLDQRTLVYINPYFEDSSLFSEIAMQYYTASSIEAHHEYPHIFSLYMQCYRELLQSNISQNFIVKYKSNSQSKCSNIFLVVLVMMELI